MPAEAPKPTGITALTTPKEPQGCLPRFLRKLFGVSEAPYSQSVSTQPSPGLEGFASKVQAGIDDQLNLKRQQVLRESLESERMSARIAELKNEEQRRVIEANERERMAAAEGMRILKDLRVHERLRYIQNAVWEGRGQIETTEEVRTLYDGINRKLATLELNYQFPALRVVKRFETNWVHEGSVNSYWQHVPATASTSLLVEVIDIGVRQGTPDLRVRVFSEVKLDGSNTDRDQTDIYKAFIPVGTETIEKDLDAALVAETATRVKRNFIPPRLEEFEAEALKKARKSPGWQREVSGDYNRSGGYHHESIGYRK